MAKHHPDLVFCRKQPGAHMNTNAHPVLVLGPEVGDGVICGRCINDTRWIGTGTVRYRLRNVSVDGAAQQGQRHKNHGSSYPLRISFLERPLRRGRQWDDKPRGIHMQKNLSNSPS